MTRRWMAVAGVASLCVVAAACSSSTPSKPPAKSTTTTTTSSAVTTTTKALEPTTTWSGTPPCTGANVGVSGKMAGGAAGHQGVVLLFVNNGSTSCALSGYPGVAGLNASGTQIAQAQRTLTGMMGGLAPGVTAIPVVTLSAGQTASAVVEGTDVTNGTETSCPTYASLLATPPNTMKSVPIPLSLPGCSGLEVHPVVPGTSGSTQF